LASIRLITSVHISWLEFVKEKFSRNKSLGCSSWKNLTSDICTTDERC
jgi:hypothetical protein